MARNSSISDLDRVREEDEEEDMFSIDNSIDDEEEDRRKDKAQAQRDNRGDRWDRGSKGVTSGTGRFASPNSRNKRNESFYFKLSDTKALHSRSDVHMKTHKATTPKGTGGRITTAPSNSTCTSTSTSTNNTNTRPHHVLKSMSHDSYAIEQKSKSPHKLRGVINYGMYV